MRIQEFIDFVKSIISSDPSKDKWDKYMVTHYHDVKVEEVRSEIVKIFIQENPSPKWPLNEAIKSKIEKLVSDLRENMTLPNGQGDNKKLGH